MATLLQRSAEWLDIFCRRSLKRLQNTIEEYYRALEKLKKDQMEWAAAAEADAEEDNYCRWPPRFDPAKERYPPVWKPIKESPQFQYYMIDAFVDPWDLENYDCIPDSNHNIKSFLQQIRESRGYDVDYPVPGYVGNPFHQEDLGSLEREDPRFYEKYKHVTLSAFEEINIHAEMHGESYAFVGIEKLVSALLTHRVVLVTFTVKQLSPTVDVDVLKTVQAMVFFEGNVNYLIEWRFKPASAASSSSGEESFQGASRSKNSDIIRL